ncbi:uncharacterized protein LOC143254976 isoform X3 [Tachypleus tridentatus]|uniref:uncharacterized protein LOC143254976 isoform X3 n=1 Tax=Tachypleus tridentatus TaxID=6853 RepID=UPI003FD5C5E4
MCLQIRAEPVSSKRLQCTEERSSRLRKKAASSMDPKITDSTRLQRLNCVKNNLPSQLAQAWEDCSATKFPGAEPLQYIKQMCNDNNKLKEMFVCVTEKLANGEVDIASLKKGLKLQNLRIRDPFTVT